MAKETPAAKAPTNEIKSETSGAIPVTDADVILELDDLGAIEIEDDESEHITRGVD